MSDLDLRTKRFDELHVFLRKSDSPEGSISSGIERVTRIPLEELRTEIALFQHRETFSFITTHNRNYND